MLVKVLPPLSCGLGLHPYSIPSVPCIFHSCALGRYGLGEGVSRWRGRLRGGKVSLRAGKGKGWKERDRPYAEGAHSLGIGRFCTRVSMGSVPALPRRG